MKRQNATILIVFLCMLLPGVIKSLTPDASGGFVENKGQVVDENQHTNPAVLFVYCGKGLKLQLRNTGYSYEPFTPSNPLEPGQNHSPANDLSLDPGKISVTNFRMDIDFLGMNREFTILKEEPSEDYLNYFTSGREALNI